MWTDELRKIEALLPSASDEELEFLLGAESAGALRDASIEPPHPIRLQLALVAGVCGTLRGAGRSQRETFWWWVTGPRSELEDLTPLEWLRRGRSSARVELLADYDAGLVESA